MSRHTITELSTRASTPAPAPPPSQANDDAHLLRLWLHGKSPNTRDAYERDVRAFAEFVSAETEDTSSLGLRQLTLQHVQDWADRLEADGLAPTTRARKLSAVKSLLTFGHRLGYLIYNVGAAVAPPKAKDGLAERILAEDQVHRVLATADAAVRAAGNDRARGRARRNALAVRLLYASGGRASEVVGLRWRDAVERAGAGERGRTAGQLTLFGKGSKTRAVLVSAQTWDELRAHRAVELTAGAGMQDDPVLRSRKKDENGRPRPLSRQRLWRIVRDLAAAAGVDKAASPHFFRHAHASHALDRGAPPHLVQQTLGHASLQTTSRYAHARPDDSSARYLGV